jgi:CRISPR/Cas system-associated exonuclease Cas4 (RecB family)
MSIYYNPQRKKNVFDNNSNEAFKISRSAIDLFLECPRCFYLDKKMGVARPNGFPFSLNNAVDTLLKKEFDIHRKKGSKHPLMETYGLEVIPLAHEKIDEWRDSRNKGIRFLHQETNLEIFGGVDDVWQNDKGELHIVDYKATSKTGEVGIDADWQISYKRQVEVYQWLFRKNGFKVSNIAYFVYCNGDTDKEAFDGKLEFDIKIIPYEGDDSWVEPTIFEIKKCLESDELPDPDPDCDYCKYRYATRKYEQ